MDIFGIGIEELLLILFVVLLVFGPGKLPEIARGMGKLVRELNKLSANLTRDFRAEFEKGLTGEEEKKEGKTPSASPEGSKPEPQS
ncbi:MAG: twin-arginine translocase TatA/TatE family subunit [Chloroflexota bacterium]